MWTKMFLYITSVNISVITRVYVYAFFKYIWHYISRWW